MERNPINQYEVYNGKVVQAKCNDEILLYKLYGPVGKVATQTPQQPTQIQQSKAPAVYQFPAVYQQPVQTQYQTQQKTTGQTQQRTGQTTYTHHVIYRQQPVYQTTAYQQQTAVYTEEKKKRGVLWLVLPLFLLFLLSAFMILHSLGIFTSPAKILDTPKNLRTNGIALSWDEVKNAGGYVIDIDGREYTTGRNGFSLSGITDGAYSIKVKAVAGGDLSDSKWSPALSYYARTKLMAPGNVTSDGTFLTWDSISGVNKYYLYINGNVYESDTNDFDLSALNLPAGDYLVKILARGPGGVDSDWTEFYYTVESKVAVPTNLRISGQSIVWDAVRGATEYSVSINGKNSTVSSNSLSIANFLPGMNFEIKVMAHSGTKKSEWSQPYVYSNCEVLPIPDGLYIANGFLQWTHILNSSGYIVEVNGQWFETGTNAFSLFAQTTPIFNKPGTYAIRVFAKGKTLADSNWTASVIYTVTKMAAPAEIRLNEGELTWSAVEDATGYVLEINGVRKNMGQSTHYFVGYEPDLYNLRVQALGNGWSVLNSDFSETLNHSVILLGNPENLQINGYTLSWDNIEHTVVYEIDVNGTIYTSTKNSFSLAAFITPNNYTVKVRAVGNGDSILDSDWSETKDYLVSLKLNSPFIVGVTDGTLAWTEVPNATAYVLEINGVRTNVGLDTRYYLGYEPNVYSIKLQALGNGWCYFDSEFSGAFNHTVVKTLKPANIKFDNGVMSWDAVDYAVRYIVEINATEYTVLTNSFSLAAFTTPNVYAVKLKAIGNGSTSLDSEWSDTKYYTVSVKLTKPANLKITSGLLSWDSSGNNVTAYIVSINGTQHNASANSYSLIGLQPDTYTIRVMAAGNNITYIDSDWSDAASYTVNRLAPPSDPVIDGPEITWDGVPQATGYTVEVNGVKTDVSVTSFSFAGLTPGEYTVRITALGNGTDNLNSDWSGELSYTVYRLGIPEDILVNDTTLIWNSSSAMLRAPRLPEGVVGYCVEVNGVEHIVENTNFSLLGLEPGIYSIRIKALGDNINYYDSDFSGYVTYTVYRLDTPTGFTISSGIISWAPVANSNGYIISINDVQTTISTTNYSLIGLAENDYTIRVLALGNNTTHYNSDWSSYANYIVVRLATPASLTVTGTTLTWTAIQYATGYVIDVDGIRYTSATSSFDLTTLKTPKTYKIQVQASGNGLTMLESLWSAQASYTIYKLSAPASVSVSGTTLSWSSVSNAIGYKIDIDGATYTTSGTSYSLSGLSAVKTYTVRVQARGNNTTHVDSDWSSSATYRISKLGTPATPTISGKTLSWGAVSSASGYYINIDGSVYTSTAASFSLAILTAYKTYSIRIQARGNGTTYVDSDWSGTRSYTISPPPPPNPDCVAEGTLITLADGSTKAVETLTGNELLLVWNFHTGKFDAAAIQFIYTEIRQEYQMVHLYFSDGSDIKFTYDQAFYDCDLNEFVFLEASNASQYIGHWFNKQTYDVHGNLSWTKVRLTGVTMRTEFTKVYSPVTFRYLCYYVNGMLSMPGGAKGLVNIFTVDKATMQYNQEAFYADIAAYGLFTYDDFVDIMPKIMFDAIQGQFLKVAMAKGLLTWDMIPFIVEQFAGVLQQQ